MKLTRRLIPKILISAVAIAACITIPMQSISEEQVAVQSKAQPQVLTHVAISHLFDQVALGKTTVGDFVSSMEQKGCFLLKDEMFSATVDSSCLKLPGHPQIQVFGCPFSGNFLEAISISFTESSESKLFGEYLKGLTKKYGAGVLSTHRLLGADQELRWKSGKALISLLEKQGDGQIDATLLYMTPGMFHMLLEEAIQDQGEAEPQIYKPPLQFI